MSYSLLMIIAVAAAVLCDFGLLRTKLLRRKAFWTAYAILFCFQIVVNGILTGLPVVRYYPEAIFGPRIVNAPVEDVGFGFALILLTLSSWVALGRRR